jgi:transaldolase / glucose-6-phosphate isomerase
MALHEDQSIEKAEKNTPQVRQSENPLGGLHKLGQSIWIDYIDQKLIASGELKRLAAEDHVTGVTSNPSIFEKAVAESRDYDDFLQSGTKDKVRNAISAYEKLAIRDIKDAADILRPVYERTGRRDGFISLEVSPYLAQDTKGTVDEARRLWNEVSRENLLIKVPATPEGIPAIRQLITDGINVNVTLLFSQKVYEQVAEAYISALEDRARRQEDVSRIASVASFFVSRIDSVIDALAESRMNASTSEEEKTKLRSLLGKVAVANAKLTYLKFKEIYGGERWRALSKKGASVQRLLWASTSTKNPKYRDVIYVEELIGPDTVNTIPPKTLDAFREHGRPRPSLEENLDEARTVMQTLAEVNISMDEVTKKLVNDGVKLFSDAFDRLLAAVDNKILSNRT